MGENSSIEWTDHTFNPWTGCTRVSPGCQHCYAESWAKRSNIVGWGPKAPRRRTSAAAWKKPRQWNAEAAREGVRMKVFVASLADIFDDHASIEPEWRWDLWKLIHETPCLDWLMLTKRPENWPTFLPVSEPSGAFANLRLGVTIEDQARFNERGPVLQFAADIGWPTFVSYEPALGPVDWSPALQPHAPAIGWMIAGGEQGPRPCHPAWIRSTEEQCRAAGVPFLLKQWGTWLVGEPSEEPDDDGNPYGLPLKFQDGETFDVVSDGHDIVFSAALGQQAGPTQIWRDYYGWQGELIRKVGKERAGRLLDGRLHDGMPSHG